MEFSDHFSTQAELYAAARPLYPDALYQFLAHHSPGNQVAVDCATGSGQAAIALTPYFKQVIGLDGSAAQLEHAIPHPQVTYRTNLAEATGLPAESADLITAAAGLHWFDFEGFFREADRVLKPGGLLACWTYAGSKIAPEVDEIVKKFVLETLRDYWPEQSRHVWNHYSEVNFPYPLLDVPEFSISAEFNFQKFEHYLLSWSASQIFMEKEQRNPFDAVRQEMLEVWGDPARKRPINWKIYLLAGNRPS